MFMLRIWLGVSCWVHCRMYLNRGCVKWIYGRKIKKKKPQTKNEKIKQYMGLIRLKKLIFFPFSQDI